MRGFIGEMLGTFILSFLGCSSVAVSVLCPPEPCCIGGDGRGRQNGGEDAAGLFCGAVLRCHHVGSDALHPVWPFHCTIRAGARHREGQRRLGGYCPYVRRVLSQPRRRHRHRLVTPRHAGRGFGTMMLVLFIFGLTEDCNVGKPSSDLQPLFIGLTVSSIIFFVSPLTQACLNPARDFGPRLVAYLAGWGSAALPDAVGGWFWVYILAPILGAIVAALLFKFILEPINTQKNKTH